MSFEKIDIADLETSFPHTLSTEYSLVGASHNNKTNALAAAWAQIGYLWNRPVATVYIRPSRYTLEFIEESGRFVISFLSGYPDEIWYMGKHSGRDENKPVNAGLTPIEIDGIATFAEAHTIIGCKVIYKQQIDLLLIEDQHIVDVHYPNGNVSYQIIGTIENIWISTQNYNNIKETA